MPDRILDISEEPAHLCVRLANLVLKRPSGEELVLALEEFAVVVASHPQVSFTLSALAGLSAANAVLVVCDDKRLPVSMLLPLQGHFVQAERMAKQVACTLPRKKRLWQQLVRAKLRSQAAALALETGEDGGLAALATRVRSGDPDNVEAQGARRYWLLIFGDPDFRRDREAAGANALLNYGYTVLRAMTARAVCAAGLHPSIGLHHHNRYSQFTLADDLMEPFRPVVDRAVLQLVRGANPIPEMDKHTKAELIAALVSRYLLAGEQRSLFEILTRAAGSLVEVMEGRREQLVLPTFPEFFPDASDL